MNKYRQVHQSAPFWRERGTIRFNEWGIVDCYMFEHRKVFVCLISFVHQLILRHIAAMFADFSLISNLYSRTCLFHLTAEKTYSFLR